MNTSKELVILQRTNKIKKKQFEFLKLAVKNVQKWHQIHKNWVGLSEKRQFQKLRKFQKKLQKWTKNHEKLQEKCTKKLERNFDKNQQEKCGKMRKKMPKKCETHPSHLTLLKRKK